MNEEWRAIPSLPEFEASSLGRVRCKPYEAMMPMGGGIRVYGGSPRFGERDDSGRPKIYFRGRNYRVSRLICEAFHGPAPFSAAVVMHGDDDPANNRPDNLTWGTQKQNLNAPAFRAYCRARTGANSPRVKGRRRQQEERV